MNQQRRSFFGRIAAFLGLVAAPAFADDRQVGSGQIGVGDEFPASERFKILYARLKRAEDDAERREVSLAGVSAAAHGATDPAQVAQRDAWAWHPAYQDTLDLRRKFEASLRMLQERIPAGQQIMLYPCGCSALANLPPGEFLPFRCGAEDHADGANSIVLNPHRAKPTIAELEEILAQDGCGPKVMILPSGQVTTV
jgi:hypothetical protein